MDGKKGGKGRGFEKFFGAGGKGSRPQGGHGREDRPYGGKPQGERGDRPYGGKSRDDRPQGDRPYGGKPQGERGDRPYGGKSRDDRPQGQYGRGGKPGDGRRYFEKDRPYREDGRYDKGPAPRPSKAPDRPVPPAVFEEGRKPARNSDRPAPRHGGPGRDFDRPAPRYGKSAHDSDRPAPRYGRPVENSDRPAPRYGRPAENSDRPAPRYGRPVENSDRPAPRYGRPVENSDRPAPRYGRPIENSDRPAPRYGRPVENSDRPAPRYGRPAPRFDKSAPKFDRPGIRYGHPAPEDQAAPAQPSAPVPPETSGSEDEGMDNLLVGRNPIREALKAGVPIEKMLVAQGELSGSARELVAKAREAGIVVQFVDRARLDAVYSNHQGMLAYASAAAYSTVEDILALAAKRDEAPFVVVLDGVTDPHNLGAIIRSAECCGAHGVIVPERRAAGLNPAAVKASAGALSYLPVARVGNLSRTLAELKEKGLWVIGCDMSGGDIRKSDLTGPVALVVGSEGEGISHLVLEGCDKVVSIPLKGQIASLNASVAAGIALYEVMRTRSGQ